MKESQEQTESTESVFAGRVRALREARGLSQAMLAVTLTMAHGIKINDSSITKLEKGDRSIRLNEAAAIADVFDMTIDEMLRPALPVDEQIRQAEQQVTRTEWRASQALGEHAAAKARLERLQEIRKEDQQ